MQGIRLVHGRGNGIDQACLATAVSMVSGKPEELDHPSTACPVVMGFVRATNDVMPLETLSQVYGPLIWELVGTRIEPQLQLIDQRDSERQKRIMAALKPEFTASIRDELKTVTGLQLMHERARILLRGAFEAFATAVNGRVRHVLAALADCSHRLGNEFETVHKVGMNVTAMTLLLSGDDSGPRFELHPMIAKRVRWDFLANTIRTALAVADQTRPRPAFALNQKQLVDRLGMFGAPPRTPYQAPSPSLAEGGPIQMSPHSLAMEWKATAELNFKMAAMGHAICYPAAIHFKPGDC